MKDKNHKSCEFSTFGQRLRKLRKSKNLRQSALAGALGYKKGNSISNIERNKNTPDFQVLIQLADLLDADLHWLITGQPSPQIKALSEKYTEIILSISGLLKNALNDLIDQKIESYEKRHFLAKEVKDDPEKQSELDKLIARIDELESTYDNAVKAYTQLLNPTFIPSLDESADTP